MPETNVTIDRAERIAYLASIGVHSDVIYCAINRSIDEDDLGMLLGLLEDILALGCAISDPE